jgi:2-C-methyl-D-erythritol 4-phosphate cytidylyltransferase
VTDTVKRQAALQDDRLARSEQTVDREGLWLAQTPQMFKANFLLECLQKAHQQGVTITDEASAVELQGVEPLLIAGSKRNLKVTWPEDFELMDRWL